MKINEIVIVTPAEWRNLSPFKGKVREITQSGAYVSRMLGKAYACITSVYYGNEEIETNHQNAEEK